MNDLICMETSPRIDLTNPESINMLNAALGSVSNFIVAASSLAQEVASLREEIAVLRAQFGDAALRLEQADAAYRTVNSQRIFAENEATELRAMNGTLMDENVAFQRNYDDACSEVVLWKEECARLVRDSDATIASANEKARAANERAYAAEAEVAQLKLSLEDARNSRDNEMRSADIWRDKFEFAEKANTTLRSMISDASLVLSGTHAAE
jgi:chromosome segregation ATPase